MQRQLSAQAVVRELERAFESELAAEKATEPPRVTAATPRGSTRVDVLHEHDDDGGDDDDTPPQLPAPHGSTRVDVFHEPESPLQTPAGQMRVAVVLGSPQQRRRARPSSEAAAEELAVARQALAQICADIDDLTARLVDL